MPDRRTPPRLSDERDTLVHFLDYLRDGMVPKVVGPDGEAATRAVVPSGTSLPGLVVPLTHVEEFWFASAFQGLDDTLPVPEPDTRPSGFRQPRGRPRARR